MRKCVAHNIILRIAIVRILHWYRRTSRLMDNCSYWTFLKSPEFSWNIANELTIDPVWTVHLFSCTGNHMCRATFLPAPGMIIFACAACATVLETVDVATGMERMASTSAINSDVVKQKWNVMSVEDKVNITGKLERDVFGCGKSTIHDIVKSKDIFYAAMEINKCLLSWRNMKKQLIQLDEAVWGWYKMLYCNGNLVIGWIIIEKDQGSREKRTL